MPSTVVFLFYFPGEVCNELMPQPVIMASVPLTLLLLMLTTTAVIISAVSGNFNDESSTESIYSSHSLSLNNVGLDEDRHGNTLDNEPLLQGPNVCTKQET